tara:strand:- start:39956 stop:40132 length:177 start_codon:yes stop_codon:yes gene_type:complete
MNTSTELLHTIATALTEGDTGALEDTRAEVQQLLQGDDELEAQLALISAAIEAIELQC